MAEEKLAPWYFPFEEDDSDPKSWDDPTQPPKTPLDLEVIHQKIRQEELRDELIRADQRRPTPMSNEAEDINKDVARTTRAMAGRVKLSKEDGYEGFPDIDMKDTIDSLGYLTYESSGSKEQRAVENEARDRTGNFLITTLKGLMDLEYQAGTTAGVTQDQLQPLQQLTEVLQDVLYVPPDERNRQNGKRKAQSRYEMDSLITLHTPKNPNTHGKKIAPAKKYNFETPARVTYTVTDHDKNQQIEFEFFPQQHAHYEKRPELAGSDTDDARGIMAVRERNVERIEEKVSRAQEGMVKPYFKVKLYDTSEVSGGIVRKKVTELKGDWTSKRVAGNEGMKTVYGFDLKPLGIEGVETFLPVTQAQGGEGHNIRALHRLVRGFSGLGFNYRPPIQPKY